MHADVDEGAEVGHVRDDAFELHAGREVLQLLHAFLEGRGLELRTRVAARLLELLQDVGDGRHAEAFVRELLGIERLQERAVADQVADRAAARREDALDDWVGLGVHRALVERVVAALDAQEAGALLERLRS